MKNCPNIDINTLNIIKKIGLDSSVKNRAILFYSICVIVRLLIAGLAYQFRNKTWLPYLVMVISTIVIYRLYNNLYGRWWWSRPFHLLMMILLFIASILTIYKYIDGKYISYLLYLDLFGGFIHSLFIKRC
tara:strand:+ start:62 stop:454 length:393 start_codon:yes stop_codon:yes gene_type:complete